MALDLVLIPNNADVITAGDQYISRPLLPGFLAAAAAFRAEADRPVYVKEGYRSDAEQRRIFLERYYRTPKVTGIRYDGSYWIKRTGFATAAIPGSSAAKHRDGEALDLWSGIDSSFTSREHLIWVRVAKPHGWDNTGRNFGEPWHQQGTPGLSPAGSDYTPIDQSQEDDMFSDLDRQKLDDVIAILAKDDGNGMRGRLESAEAKIDVLTNIIAKDTDDSGVTGGLRGLLRDIRKNAYLAQASSGNVEKILAKDAGGGMRALLTRLVKKNNA